MFQEHLKKLVENVEGGTAAILMGFDGIAVDSYTLDAVKPDIQTVGMEFSFVLTQIRKAAEALGTGAVEETTIRSGSMLLVMRVLTTEYFLALALTPDGNFGKGRYLLRLFAPKFLAEL